MNIHEYQAKQLLAKFGVPVSKGIACKTADEVGKAFTDLGVPLDQAIPRAHELMEGKLRGRVVVTIG